MSVFHYDPLSSETLANPFGIYAQLRETCPVYWHENMRSWVVSRYKDCLAVLLQPALFASDWRRVGEDIPASSMHIQSLDPPGQRAVRQLFMNGFHTQNMSALEARAFRLSWDTLESFQQNTSFDVIKEVAIPMALDSVSELLGISPPDLDSFNAISDAIVRGMDAGLRPEVRDSGVAARAELSELVESWFADGPQRGLIGYLLRHQDRTAVPDDVLINTTRIVFQAGYSSLSVAAGNALLALLRNPARLRQLAAEPALLDTGVDELMRYDGPVQGTSRVCVEDTQIGGQRLRRGDVVVVLFASANHDPEQFHSPETLVLDRNPNPHLAFGWGPHACAGTRHARAALKGFLRAFVTQPHLPVLAGEPTRKRRATVRCLHALDVSLTGGYLP